MTSGLGAPYLPVSIWTVKDWPLMVLQSIQSSCITVDNDVTHMSVT
jgi:hypothetical protein